MPERLNFSFRNAHAITFHLLVSDRLRFQCYIGSNTERVVYPYSENSEPCLIDTAISCTHTYKTMYEDRIAADGFQTGVAEEHKGVVPRKIGLFLASCMKTLSKIAIMEREWR